MKLSKETLFQFLKFGIVGVSNTVISLGVYYIVLGINQNWYLAGNILGWVISVANAYFWNRRYVFTSFEERATNQLKLIGKTYLSYAFTFVLTTILLYLEVDIARLSAVFCPLANLLITVPLNYLLNKFWAFK